MCDRIGPTYDACETADRFIERRHVPEEQGKTVHRAPTKSITKLGNQVLQVSPRYADRGRRTAVLIDMTGLKADNFVSGVKKLTNRAQCLGCRCIKFAAELRFGYRRQNWNTLCDAAGCPCNARDRLRKRAHATNWAGASQVSQVII